MTKTTREAEPCLVGAMLKHEFGAAMAQHSGTFAERERKALALANELVRGWLETTAQSQADEFGDQVVVEGQMYRRHSKGAAVYHSLCGPIHVTRSTYRLVGMHNGPTVVPTELALGLCERATPALVQSAVQGFAAMPLRAYEAEMTAAHRSVPSRSTLERIAKRVGTVLHQELPIIEPVVRASERVPRGAHSISIGIDRTSVPMAEPTGQPSRRRRHHQRQPPAPIEVHYRMAYIATVAVNDQAGDVLTSVRFAATVQEGSDELLERLAAEVRHILCQRPRLQVLAIQDGAPELRRLVDEWEENFQIPIAMRLVDRYHVDQRLAEVAELIESRPGERWLLLDKWKRSMKRSDLAVERLCRGFRALVRDIYDDDDDPADLCAAPISRAVIHGARAKVIEGHLTYFANIRSRCAYATARRLGYPIGSGPTEGACKSVVAARCKRSGQRWHDPGLSPCLHMRTLYLNDRLNRSIDHLISNVRERLVSV